MRSELSAQPTSLAMGLFSERQRVRSSCSSQSAQVVMPSLAAQLRGLHHEAASLPPQPGQLPAR